jgi:hypothetical protein
LNFATFSNDSLATLIFWFCPGFRWRVIFIYFVSSAFISRPTYPYRMLLKKKNTVTVIQVSKFDIWYSAPYFELHVHLIHVQIHYFNTAYSVEPSATWVTKGIFYSRQRLNSFLRHHTQTGSVVNRGAGAWS